MKIPDDLSVTGFDNIGSSAYTNPPLTTFDQPKRFIGMEAARLLLRLLDSMPDEGEKVKILRGSLLVRASTASCSMIRFPMIVTNSNLDVLPRSVTTQANVEYALAQTNAGPRLVVCAPTPSGMLQAFEGEHTELADRALLLCPLNPVNASALRSQLTWLQPCPLGLRTSAGMGDRIGLATPGHVRAVRATGSSIAPIFAPQSIREMTRTERTPQQVMDDATWGIFQEGWKGGAGADADHLKTTEDIDTCLAARYSFFTIVPGAHVDDRVETANLDTLREPAALLPNHIQPRASGLSGGSFDI